MPLSWRHAPGSYRYKRQRYTTLIVKAPRSFVDKTLWPEYLELKQALDEYLNEAIERIIREEVFGYTRAGARTGRLSGDVHSPKLAVHRRQHREGLPAPGDSPE
jgi:hypothetical protein